MYVGKSKWRSHCNFCNTCWLLPVGGRHKHKLFTCHPLMQIGNGCSEEPSVTRQTSTASQLFFLCVKRGPDKHYPNCFSYIMYPVGSHFKFNNQTWWTTGPLCSLGRTKTISFFWTKNGKIWIKQFRCEHALSDVLCFNVLFQLIVLASVQCRVTKSQSNQGCTWL